MIFRYILEIRNNTLSNILYNNKILILTNYSTVIQLAKQFPNIVHPGKLNDLQKEFGYYRCLPFDEVQLRVPIDEFWGLMATQTKPGTALPQFPLLAEFCLALCVLPHGNADCKRVFSMVRHIKTEFRNKLGNDTEQAIIAVNRNTIQNGNQCCYTVKATDEVLKAAKSATSRALKQKVK